MEGSNKETIVAVDFSKSDLILLMQILNKAQKRYRNTYIEKQLPRIQRKIDERLLEMINEETNV